jgi:hypothetical protein
MATPLADLVKLTERRCPAGPAVPGVSGTADYVADALARLNDVAPREVKLQITGDTTDEYPLGDDWSEGFSYVKRVRMVESADFDEPAIWIEHEDYEVEYGRSQVTAEAVGDGDGEKVVFALAVDQAIDGGAEVTVDAVPLAGTAFQVFSGPDGSGIRFNTAPPDGDAIVATYYYAVPQIRFLRWVPSSSDRIIVEFTAPHELEDDSTTLNVNDQKALADLAAAMKCEAAAIACLALIDQDSQEDMVDFDRGDRAAKLENAAKRLRASFNTHFGITSTTGLPDEAPSSFAMVDVDVPTTTSSRYRHTHPRNEF